jgi:hypothetical protein
MKDLQTVYKYPEDVKRLAKLHSVNRKVFSIKLLESRLESMDPVTQRRAWRTINALKFERYWDHV